MTLQAKLDAFKVDFEAGKPPYSVPRSVIETMHRATQELIASGAAQRTLKAEDKAPLFTLKDPEGNSVSSAALLAHGPLVVSFYRGVWCPYCNMELQALEAARPEFEQLGAKLVAISPSVIDPEDHGLRAAPPDGAQWVCGAALAWGSPGSVDSLEFGFRA